MVAGITHEEIAAALEQAIQEARETGDAKIDYGLGLTTRELAKHLNVAPRYANELIREAVLAGTVRCTGIRKIRNIARRWSSIPIYGPVLDSKDES